MFVLELRVLPVLRRSPEGSGVPMDFADGQSFGHLESVVGWRKASVNDERAEYKWLML